MAEEKKTDKEAITKKVRVADIDGKEVAQPKEEQKKPKKLKKELDPPVASKDPGALDSKLVSILRVVFAHSGIDAQTVAGVLSIPTVEVNVALQKLHADGMVRRSSKVWMVSPQGVKELSTHQKIAESKEESPEK
jgi:hypothetical protein